MANANPLPVKVRDSNLIVMCGAILSVVVAGLLLPYFMPGDRFALQTAIVGCGLVQFICLAAWYIHQRRVSDEDCSGGESAEENPPPISANSTTANQFENPSWNDLLNEFRGRVAAALTSSISECRRYAIHILSSLSDSPIGSLDCWPQLNCSRLQFAAAEAILREWLEYVDSPAKLTENQLIHLMYPVEYEEVERPRVRKLATWPPEPHAEPEATNRVVRTLQRWNDAVKDTILDGTIADEENEFSSPEEDEPLTALDREKYISSLQQQFGDIASHIADTVSTPGTDFELAKTEEEVGRFLQEFRWDALALAIDMRVGGAPPIAEASKQRCSPSPRPPRQSDDWAKKYRRMRALG
jgi:hypothetical protein